MISTVKKGENVYLSINLTFEESITGVEKQMLIKKNMRCGECEGNRCLRGTLPKRCWTCYGKGVEVVKTGPYLEETRCKNCDGSGLTITHKCPNCHGHGVLLCNYLDKLRIKGFVEDGDLIKFEHKGHESPNSYSGDLYLTVFIDQHPYFTREDCDLIVTVPVSYATSVLGGTIEIPQFDGPSKKITVSHVEPMSKMIFEQEGLLNKKAGKKGKQIVIFKVAERQPLTDFEQNLYNKLKESGL